MNFYASHDYIEAVAEVYFKGRKTSVEDVRIGDDVLRLLVVDNSHVVTSAVFLDYHQPLQQSEIGETTRRFGHAKAVARRVIELAEWRPGEFEGLELAPFIDWSKFATYDEYQAYILQRNKGLIRDRERRGRRLAEAFGEIVFKMDDDRDDVFETARIWKTQQLRESGLKNWFADGTIAEFLKLLRQRGALKASTLRASGRLLAVWIGFVHDGVWSGWIFTYDPDLAKYSVGHQLLNAMLEESFRLKHREFDFSTGGESYKMIYATHGRIIGPIGRPPLARQLIALAKKEVKRRSPKLVEMAHSFVKELNRRSFKNA
jgi:CelD/BcsL family acetyltransferase involved in cellulose biosynthesis